MITMEMICSHRFSPPFSCTSNTSNHSLSYIVQLSPIAVLLPQEKSRKKDKAPFLLQACYQSRTLSQVSPFRTKHLPLNFLRAEFPKHRTVSSLPAKHPKSILQRPLDTWHLFFVLLYFPLALRITIVKDDLSWLPRRLI